MALNQIKLIAVVGPTASGKSSLAIELAKRFNGEIVSCDSMQIYRKMDIGTAKADAKERAEVPHHLLDIADPNENRDLSDFVTAAHEAIADIAGRGKLPVLCGGTGLYVDNILFDTTLSEAGGDEEYRCSLEEKNNEELYEMLKEIDPVCAEGNHPNNRRRVIRALEIFHCTGKTKTEWDALSRRKTSRYDTLIIGLGASERELLYRRIEDRVDEMMDMGLAREVAELYPVMGDTARQAIGYKEIYRAIAGLCTMEQAVSDLKTATRRYAKRQLTWFRSNPAVCWLDIATLDKRALAEAASALVRGHLQEE